MTTDEKIDYLYCFVKNFVDKLPRYDKNGLLIIKCHICGTDFKMHPEQNVCQRIQFYGRDDICPECMTKELEKRGML